MTEREYVELIRSKAAAYIAEVSREPGEMTVKPITEWNDTKIMLSAHTAIRLCDAWLAGEIEGTDAE
jgi:hypothetical protein